MRALLCASQIQFTSYCIKLYSTLILSTHLSLCLSVCSLQVFQLQLSWVNLMYTNIITFYIYLLKHTLWGLSENFTGSHPLQAHVFTVAQTNSVQGSPHPHTRTRVVHLTLLNIMAVMIFGRKVKVWSSSLLHFLHSPITSAPLRSKLSPQHHVLKHSQTWHQVSHPHTVQLKLWHRRLQHYTRNWATRSCTARGTRSQKLISCYYKYTA